MPNATYTFELVEQEKFKFELVEKELITINLNVVDIVCKGSGGSGASALADLDDVNLGSLTNKDILAYISGIWRNTRFEDLLAEFTIIETPTMINSKRFQTSNPYKSGKIIVYLNGLKEKYITEISSNQFEFEIDIDLTDEVEIMYFKD